MNRVLRIKGLDGNGREPEVAKFRLGIRGLIVRLFREYRGDASMTPAIPSAGNHTPGQGVAVTPENAPVQLAEFVPLVTTVPM